MMEITDNILPIFFTLFLYISYSDSAKFSKPQEHSKYRRINLDPKDEACFCFEKKPGSVMVSDLLDVKDSGLNRLVVYLYQDNNEKEIKMYTPSAEKQRSIPDFTFENGDSIIKLTNEQVSEIFKSSHSIISVHNEKVNNFYTEIDNSINKINNTVTDVDGSQSELLFVSKLDNSNTESYKSPIDVHTLENIQNLPDSSYHQTQSFADYGNIVHDGNNIVLYQYDNNNLHPSTGTVDAKDKSIIESHSHHGIHYIETPNPSPSQPLVIDFYESVLPSITNSMPKQDKVIDGTEKTKIESHNFNIFHDSGLPIETFDIWFNEQMKRVQEKQHLKSNSIDIVTLKRLIEQSLGANGMSISEYGVLIDATGNQMNMTNLRLRPILIGKSMEFEKMTKGAANNRFVLPADTPYLESILINIVSPPQVLGIIPLGTTYIPRKMIHVPHHILDIEESTNNEEMSNYQRQNLNNMMIETRKSPRPIIPGSLNLAHKYWEGYRRKSDQNRESLLSKGLKNTSNMMSQIAQNPFNTFNGLMETLKDILNTNKPSPPVEEEITDKPDSEIESDEDEGPGFRIIGGETATSSGSMINNRGRSGFII